MDPKPSIFDFSRTALAEALAEDSQPVWRADQVFDWIYRKGAAEPSVMANIPKTYRERLVERFDFTLPCVSDRLLADDGTIKYRVVFADGQAAECVMMPNFDGMDRASAVSMCISSQVGCPLACAFCATGTMGLKRNLTAGEIVSQVVLMLRELPEEPDSVNILFMGMGEPLLNTDNVIAALELFYEEKGLNISPRRITISTVGIPKGIDRLFAMNKPPMLALSLHAPDQELRARLMPVAKKYKLDQILTICRELPLAARRMITMEYVLLRAVNDRPEHARALAAALSGIRAKINLIPHNPVAGLPFEDPEETAIDTFMTTLRDLGMTATVRRSRGRSAAAACGQLAIRKLAAGGI